MSEHSIRMKLLIDAQSNRVLLAEADKECVDFLFYILSLPVATLIALVRKHVQGDDMAGSLPNLYESLQNLNIGYIQPNQTKDTLLKPVPPLTGFSVPLLTVDEEDTNTSSVKDEGGFVKGGAVSYMVMDDLTVLPMLDVSSIAILNKYDIKDVGMLEEKLVSMGMLEAVKLVKASMETKNVLTSVFLIGLGSSAVPESSENKKDADHMVSRKTSSWFEIAGNNNFMLEVNNYVNLQGAGSLVEASSSIYSPEQVCNDDSDSRKDPPGPTSSPEPETAVVVRSYRYVPQSQRSPTPRSKDYKSKKKRSHNI